MPVHPLIRNTITLAAISLASAGMTAAAKAAEAPLKVSDGERTIVVDNGKIIVTLNKASGKIDMIQHRQGDKVIDLSKPGEGMYWDANVDLLEISPEMDAKKPRAGYSNINRYGTPTVKIASQTDAAVDLVASAAPNYWFPFEVENHFVIPKNDSGFYAYTILRHRAGMAGGKIAQTRFVLKGLPGTSLFTHWVVDDQRKGHRPTSPAVETIQDATERLADGTAFTKYDLTAFTYNYLAHGMAGDGAAGDGQGLWVCYPSTESFNGGPTRQDLTVHNENVLLAMWQSQHFGAAPAEIARDEAWEHLYGPVLVYVNSSESVDSMFTDAKLRALEEQKKWPYAWLRNDAYPLERGTVRGSVRMSDGTIPAGAWAILTMPGEADWALSSKGYQFWTRVQPDGSFTIPKVRPGSYRLHLSGGDQPDDLQQDGITLTANQTTDLGQIVWTPRTHGQTLWQIGTFDRSTIEYRFGEESFHRNYDAFKRYFTAFPEDVTYVIGKSRESTHWNYAQWAWFNKKPVWTVQFNMEKPVAGRATLTVGLASVRPAGALQIKVNGTEVASLEMPKSGAAGYRSGAQDSKYNLKRIEFDAALLKAGLNEITFGHTKAVPLPVGDALTTAKRPPGEVMYDAIRLDIAETK